MWFLWYLIPKLAIVLIFPNRSNMHGLPEPVILISMLTIASIIPAVIIIAGYRLRKPSKTMLGIFGDFAYCTKRSMKNEDTWDFAHKHYSRTSRWIGFVALPVSLAVMLSCSGEDVGAALASLRMLCNFQILAMAVSGIPTGIALRINFDSDGRRLVKEATVSK
jgi:hypothetical protein